MEPSARSDAHSPLYVARGAVLLLSFVVTLALPGPSSWPVCWLAPLALYLLVVLLVAPLRRGAAAWSLLGQTNRSVVLAAAIVALGSAAGLLVFQSLVKPDFGGLHSFLPEGYYGSFLGFAVLFSLLNAAVEEFVFRGVLYEAVVAEYGPRLAVVTTALLFGIVHAGGYPPGLIGVVLATIYGLLQGLLRAQSGGVLWPWVSHVVVDSTIMAMIALDE